MAADRTVYVIGAGIGMLVACELAKRGYTVKILDEQPRPLAGASGRHGRRLHLGEHYSGDPFVDGSLNTAQRCMLGALALLQRWPGVASIPGRWWQFITTDSMTSGEEYLAFAEQLREFHQELVEEGIDSSLPFGPSAERHRRISRPEYEDLVDASRVALALESREPVIDATALNAAIRGELAAADGVEVLSRHRVRSIEERSGSYRLDVVAPDGECELEAQYVVNVAWHGLGRLGMELDDERQPNTARLRMMAEVSLPPALSEAPSMYFHRGVFGNHTNLGTGYALVLAETVCNLAFHPAHECPEAWVELVRADLAEDEWAEPLAAVAADLSASPEMDVAALAMVERLGEICAENGDDSALCSEELRREIGERIIAEYRDLVPLFGEADARVKRLIPNIVVAPGDAVLSDPASAVHRRDAVVREPRPGYFEVLTGKLTYAVLVAQEATALVLGRTREIDLEAARDQIMSPTVRRAWAG